jgi:DNA-binding transcriptional LysR family regulator
MGKASQFTGLAEFVAVARHKSFRSAAAELGVTPSAVSLAVGALERRIGQSLFRRTTRSVSLTEAGEAFYASVEPAADQIRQALEQTFDGARSPSGRLRLSVPRIAVELILAPVMPVFRERFPDVELDLDISDISVDIARDRYDAGIRIGEDIEKDMVAVRLTPDLQWTVVASPGYLSAHGRPRKPQDLLDHRCIRYRFPTANSVYRWQFSEGKTLYAIEPGKGVTVNDHLTMVRLAREGLGFAYSAELVVARELAEGKLVKVLDGYLPRRRECVSIFRPAARRSPNCALSSTLPNRFCGPMRPPDPRPEINRTSADIQ